MTLLASASLTSSRHYGGAMLRMDRPGPRQASADATPKSAHLRSHVTWIPASAGMPVMVGHLSCSEPSADRGR